MNELHQRMSRDLFILGYEYNVLERFDRIHRNGGNKMINFDLVGLNIDAVLLRIFLTIHPFMN
jgi:hypothetical protein